MKKLLLIPVIILFLAIISAVIFIGGGYLISLVIPLTLFQASILCIGATFVSVFIITIILAGMAFAEYRERGYDYGEYDYEDDEEEEDDDDEDVEEDETDNTTKRKIIDIKTVKTGRNEPCPCGSGKKYKRCCGK
jgi:uncharacterized membrane protein